RKAASSLSRACVPALPTVEVVHECDPGACSDGRNRTAIDGDHGARDKRCGWRQQESCYPGELLRLTVPTQRNVRRLAGAHLIGIAAEGIQFADSVSRDPDGQQTVDPEPERAKLAGQGLRHAGKPWKQAVGDGELR